MGMIFIDILLLALQLYSAYFIVIALFGIIKRKRRIVKPPKTKFAIVIAARNEQAVIGKLIDSLQKQAYAKTLYDIYVAPNNCTDNTEGESLAHGAKIIRCTKPVHNKGDALNQAFMYLMRDEAEKVYDAFMVFDADNVVDKNFLAEMNNAFCAGAKVVKGKSVAKTPMIHGFQAATQYITGLQTYFTIAPGPTLDFPQSWWAQGLLWLALC